MSRVIEAGDDFRRIRVHGMAQANENVYGWCVFAGFQHTDVLAGNTGAGRNFLLGEAGFQSKFAQLFSEHPPDANRRRIASL